jgi:hypothetical protein
MTMTTKKSLTTKPPATKAVRKKPAVTRVAGSQPVATKKVELTENSFVHEIFDAVSSERIGSKKIEILQRFDHNYIKSVLIWNFDPSITSAIPEGEVPIQPKENPEVQPSSSIKKEWTKFYNFVKGGNDSMNKLRKETMFINILESLHPLEAEILILVKDKKLQTKYNITKEIVTQSYPDIIWGDRS